MRRSKGDIRPRMLLHDTHIEKGIIVISLPDSVNLLFTEGSIECQLAPRPQIDVHHTTLASR